MLSLNWNAVGPEYPESYHKDDELLFVITREEESLPNWIIKWEQEAIPVLGREIEYLKVFAGFAQKNRKPFVVLRWMEDGRKPLEKRWLVGQLFKRLRHQFSGINSLNVYLAGETLDPLQIVLAEDLFNSCQNREKAFPQLESFCVLVNSLDQVHKAEPHQEERFQYNQQVRHWINENPDTLTSLKIGEWLEAFAKQNDCTFQSMGEEELRKEGMNLLIAVGQASEISPSRCFLLSANCKPGDRPLMLAGKGVTFDTGGINVKPFEGFVNCMKNDMGGAALMANLFMALVKSGYKKPLALVIPSCENLVAQKSMKPGAVYRSHKGINVVVDHTDAEGRLILADALSYGEGVFNPYLTIVAATLTTASLRQYTGYTTPVYFASEEFKRSLHDHGVKYGEQFSFQDYFLPFKWANKGKSAQLTNMGRLPQNADIGGGSNVAAHFLRQFIDGSMVHLDIFASAWNWSGDYPGAVYGATGAVFNSLFATINSGDF